jgi:hypothetical protein
MTLPPMVRKTVMKRCCRERNRGAFVPCLTLLKGDTVMAGILLWLMGVPLIVIILLYLVF